VSPYVATSSLSPRTSCSVTSLHHVSSAMALPHQQTQELRECPPRFRMLMTAIVTQVTRG
jgi:hypothetical protein